MKKSYFSFLPILIMSITFTNVSQAIEVNPTEGQIDETIKYGEEHPGKEIFKTEFVAPATFGNWPKFGGGLIKSKLIDLVIMSAMMGKARKKVTEEEAHEMMESKDLTVSFRGGADVYKIKLRQGSRVIEPKKMIKPEMRGKDLAKHAIFIVARFPYFKLDLNAMTSIVVIKDFGTIEYEVDFSNIR